MVESQLRPKDISDHDTTKYSRVIRFDFIPDDLNMLTINVLHKSTRIQFGLPNALSQP